jgi:hypothetical protein
MVGFQAVLHALFCLAASGGEHSILDRLLCHGRPGHRPSAELTRRLLALRPNVAGADHGSGAGASHYGALALLPAATPASLVMFGGHLAAAVAAAWWLHRTDAAVTRAAALVAAGRRRGRRRARTRPTSLGVVAAALGAGSSAVRAVRRRDVPPPAAVQWFRTPVRRGPPAFA